MMNITATELKLNLGKYIELASKEDIYISKNGRRIAKLTNTVDSKLEALDSLVGIIPSDVDEEVMKAERLANK